FARSHAEYAQRMVVDETCDDPSPPPAWRVLELAAQIFSRSPDGCLRGRPLAVSAEDVHEKWSRASGALRITRPVHPQDTRLRGPVMQQSFERRDSFRRRQGVEPARLEALAETPIGRHACRGPGAPIDA